MSKALKNKIYKLNNSIELAEDYMKQFRDIRYALMCEYTGNMYSRRSDKNGFNPSGKIPFNSIYQTVSIVVPNLVFREPKPLISTKNSMLRPEALSLSLVMEDVMCKIRFGQTMRKAVFDALFGAGIVKCGLAQQEQVEGFEDPDGTLHYYGQPFIDNVDLDDYIVDPTARNRETATFEGNRYRIPRDYAYDCGMFDKKALDNVNTWKNIVYNNNKTRVSNITSINEAEGDEWFEWLELIDLWLPYENKVITVAGDLEANIQDILREVDWEGPERGPYEVLGFNWIPENVMPMAPLSVILDLHTLLNKEARKAGRQADRAKQLVLFNEVHAEEAKDVQNSNDGEIIGVSDVNGYKQVEMGGVSDTLYKNMDWLRQAISQLSGNTDLLGGVQAPSETLGQDEILQNNANLRINDMRSQTFDFMRLNMEKIAYYVWEDPFSNYNLTKKIKGGVEVETSFNAENKQGKFEDYNFEIEPYSTAPDSPQSKYRRTLQWLQTIVLPLAQSGQAQGLQIDVQRIVKETGALVNLDWADEVFMTPAPVSPEQEMLGQGQGQAISPPSNTENITINGRREQRMQRQAGQDYSRKPEITKEPVNG